MAISNKLSKENMTVKARKRVVKTAELDFTIHSSHLFLGGIYESSRVLFAICSDLKDGTVKLLSDFTSCRESLSGMMSSIINGKNERKKIWLPKSKTCVLALINTSGNHDNKVLLSGKKRSKETYENWTPRIFKAGLSIVNHYERRNRWLLTKLCKVNYVLPDDKKPTSIIYHLAGSKWWMNSPHALSLFCLLIRLGRHEETRELRLNSSHDKVIEILNKIKESPSVTEFGDNNMIYPSKWDAFLNNYKEIYKDRETPEANWKASVNTYDGIQSLIYRSCRDKIIQNRFDKVS